MAAEARLLSCEACRFRQPYRHPRSDNPSLLLDRNSVSDELFAPVGIPLGRPVVAPRGGTEEIARSVKTSKTKNTPARQRIRQPPTQADHSATGAREQRVFRQGQRCCAVGKSFEMLRG